MKIRYLLSGLVATAVLSLLAIYFYMGLVTEKTFINDPNAYPMRLPPPVSEELEQLHELINIRNEAVEDTVRNRYHELREERELARKWARYTEPGIGDFLLPFHTEREKHLREELVRRNVSEAETRVYISKVKRFYPKLLMNKSEFIWFREAPGIEDRPNL